MNGQISVLSIILFATGAVLIYSAVKDKNPVEVVKLSLQGKNPADAKPVGGG